MTEDWRRLTLRDFGGAVAGRDPRAALMWPPTALDVARIVAAARAVSPDPAVLDAGCGSGLLARLLTVAGLRVHAVDNGDGTRKDRLGRFFPADLKSADKVEGRFDLAVVSWMEAGRDYREAVVKRASLVFQARDRGGGCGVRGDTSFAPFGLAQVAEWEGPGWEDVDHALRTRGRGPGGSGLRRERPGNVLEVWAPPNLADRLAVALESAEAGESYPWEAEMRALGLLGPEG